MALPPVLVGHDVALFALAANGRDGFPNLGPPIGLLGRWKELTLNMMVTRSEVTPSDQLLTERRVTGLDWNIGISNYIRSGGGFGTFFIFNGNLNVQMEFTEETNGATFTAFGGITEANYKAVREGREEDLKIVNVGPIGNTGSSLFYTFNGPVTVDQSSNLAYASSAAVQAATTQGYTTKAGITYAPYGFIG